MSTNMASAAVSDKKIINPPIGSFMVGSATYLDLIQSFSVDFTAAAGAAFCVAPFITIVDRSIIQNASGAKNLKLALKDGVKDAIMRPQRFVARMDFLWIWLLYTVTYTVANGVDTVCSAKSINPGMPKFVGTTMFNMPLCILKDRAFTRMFGVIAPTKLPRISYGLFALRDMATLGASFTLPKTVSIEMQQRYGIEKGKANTIAQLLCPMAVQFFSTPIHLLGLDYYNNKGVTFATRAKFIKGAYVPSTLARMGRIGPAFGVGGIGNKYFRDTLQAATGLNKTLRLA